MGVFADIFNLIWRDGSGTPHQPLKNEIRTIGETLDVAFAARDDLISSVNTKLESSVLLVSAALIVGADAPLGSEYTSDPQGRVSAYVDASGQPQAGGTAGFGPVYGVPADGAEAVPAALVVGTGVAIGGSYEIDQDGRLVSMTGSDGVIYAAGAGGFGAAVRASVEAPVFASNFVGNGAGNYISPAVYARTDNALYCLAICGQSLGEGVNGNATGDNAFTTVPPYPENAFMPSVGAYLRGSGARFSSLVPLRESDPFSFIHETQATSLAQHLLADLEAETGSMPDLVMFNASIGGNTWEQLMPGSQAWTLLVNAVSDCATIAAAQARRLVVPAVVCNIGESNLNVAKTQSAAFIAMMRKAVRELNRDIKAITGQTEDVVMMIWGIIFAPGGQYGENHICDAFSRLDDPLIRVIGPHYAMTMSDDIHHDSMGYYRMGKVAARAIRDEIFGPGYSPMRLLSSGWISATKFRLTFNVPVAPIVIDTTGTDVHVPLAGTTNGWAGSRYGLEADDGAGNAIDLSAATFAVVTPSGGYPACAIDVTLPAPPTAKDLWLSYAWHPDGDHPGECGPVVGPRGCFRDSASMVSAEDGRVDHNWCLPFRARLGERLI